MFYCMKCNDHLPVVPQVFYEMLTFQSLCFVINVLISCHSYIISNYIWCLLVLITIFAYFPKVMFTTRRQEGHRGIRPVKTEW